MSARRFVVSVIMSTTSSPPPLESVTNAKYAPAYWACSTLSTKEHSLKEMGHPFFDQAVKILAVNKLLDERSAVLLRQTAATAAGLLLGAFFFGRKGAFAGGLVGAILAYEPLPNYKQLLSQARALDDGDKETLASILQTLSGCGTLEGFAKWSEDESNAKDVFVAIEKFLDSKKSTK